MAMTGLADLSIPPGRSRWCLSPPAAFVAAAVLTVVLALPQQARAASANEMRATSQAWQKQNNCTLDSFHRFPDYTPRSNANRDRATRACEAKNHLPLRQDGEHSPVVRMPDSEADE
jgi:hypothetical protein